MVQYEVDKFWVPDTHGQFHLRNLRDWIWLDQTAEFFGTAEMLVIA